MIRGSSRWIPSWPIMWDSNISVKSISYYQQICHSEKDMTSVRHSEHRHKEQLQTSRGMQHAQLTHDILFMLVYRRSHHHAHLAVCMFGDCLDCSSHCVVCVFCVSREFGEQD